MNWADWMNLLLALAALATAWRALSVQREQAETEKESLELSKAQAAAEAAAALAASKAAIDIEIGDGHFLIVNTGGSPAFRISLVAHSAANGIDAVEDAGELPIRRLDPGKTYPLLINRTLRCSAPYEVVVSWEDDEGRSQSKDMLIK